MWDDDDSDYFEGFIDAMIWFFSGPLWVFVLIIVIVALGLWWF